MSFFSNIAAAFKGTADSRVPLGSAVPQGFISPWAQAFEGRSARRNFDYGDSVEQAFVKNPIAQRAIRIVSELVGSAPIQSSRGAPEALVTASSAGQSLIETLAMHLLIHGNGYVQIMKDASGTPVELYALRPERLSILPDENGWPAAYQYSVGGDNLTIAKEDEAGWPNIIHIKGLHPSDDHYGAGSLQAAHQSVAIHNAASEWNLSLLENAARPSGALIYENAETSGLTSEQFERLKAELNAAYTGEANAGRPMLLEGGLDWKAMSLSPADMDFATLKAAAARDIALAFGVPPMLLGLPGDNTYANYKEANRALWRLTLLPLATKIYAGLMQGLSDWFPNSAITVDLDQITALSEDRERLWSQIGSADFLSTAEKRKMLGLEAETPPPASPTPSRQPETPNE